MSNIILGVDISKLTFDVALLNDNKVKTKKFSNTSKGFSELKRVQWKNTQKCRFIFKKPLVYKPLRDFIIFSILKILLFSKKIGRV